MSQVAPSRLYIRSPDGQYAKLLWVHNFRPNEMLLGFYSLNGGPATITYEFPEKEIEAGDRGPFSFKYKDASRVTEALDHFTCHADGTFHAKSRGDEPVYSHVERRAEPTGPATPPFLDILVISDIVSRYAFSRDEPKNPNVWYDALPGGILVLNCLFSGADYPVEREALGAMASRNRTSGAVILSSGTLKGAIWGGPSAIPHEAAANRPQATIVVFAWPRAAGNRGSKAFILN